MARLFINEYGKNLTNTELLLNYVKKPYNTSTYGHNDLINNCTTEVKKKLQELKLIDTKILIGLTLATISLSLPLFIYPLGLLALTGLSYSCYQLGNRKKPFSEYEFALKNLINCCHWVLGEVDDSNTKLINRLEITNMLKVLNPLTSEAQLRHYIDNKFDNIFHDEIDKDLRARRRVRIKNYKLQKQEANLYYKIYGYEQGNISDVLEGIAFVITESFKSITDKLNVIKNKPKEKNSPSISPDSSL